ncbi:Predicted arabinose efflux permease, MFS family [Sporobacter termitidis DSM 10068]|uniref:Predicted arabinose efflux permease, MFS family n=1 Tax=Sporobacter termitidis DSM 10068 TaxID=1123282 RepID=A0A1M5TMW8_9FIRM|nr:Predicted arabinose efflux permease, MFS family [Sporobacter termitidis DSM 10068]
MKRGSAAITVSNPFAALRHRNYRLYWIGMAISTTGTWMQNVAQPWLAYELTRSPFLLSLIGALQFTPVLLFSLFAGVLIDRFEKRRILFVTQTAAMLISLTVAILTAAGYIQYWHLIITSTLMGFVNTVDMPTRQSFVIELVGREDLTNGIALNSAQFNLARILGPALAGVIMGQWGVAVCFFIDAASFGAVLISLFFVRPYPTEKTPMPQVNIFASIGEGLKFIFHREVLFLPLIFLAVGATFAMNFNVLVPVFSIEVLGQEETGFGLLMSMAGVGALAGALTMAIVARGGPRKVFLFVFPIVAGALIVALGLTRVYIMAGLALMFASFFYMIFMASVNTTMQMNATQEFRGRVMSVYSLIVAGSTPLGNLFAGTIADRAGAGVSFIVCGGVILVLLIPLSLYRRARERSRMACE